MNSKYFSLILYALVCLVNGAIFAQDQLVPMAINPLVRGGASKFNTLQKGNQPAIILPFFDDFSDARLFPMEKLWSDNNVFINNTYAINPITLGVATFDAVDSIGRVYPHASSASSIMDYLSSNSIRLDSIFSPNPKKLTPADSIYISFFIQPAGIGNTPDIADSIVLQFYNTATNTWQSVWKLAGLSLDSFESKYGTKMAQFLIPITNIQYFTNDFKFRFLNYASILNNTIPSWRSGMYDFWHLDYVYLDHNRTFNDSTINDVALASNVSSLLKNYQAMPWNQFKVSPAAEMDYTKTIKTVNLDKSAVQKNVNRFFGVYSKSDDSLWRANPYPNAINMGPLSVNIFAPTYNDLIFYSANTDYADFLVIYNIDNSTPPLDISHENDTLMFWQRFYNYFAYDDGIPEAGYGLSSEHAKFAYKFKLNKPDSLQSIQMYFNQTIGMANQQYFDMVIWADNAGQPGAELYRKTGRRPEFENELFKFHTYVLDQAVYLSGTFYVGFEQITKDNLNIGFDLNNDNKTKIFYNTNGTWQNSSFSGSVMLRPVFGVEDQVHVGIEKTNLQNQFQIFPNPNSSSILNFKLDESFDGQNSIIEIFSTTGELVLKTPLTDTINIENLKSGLYFVRILNSEKGISMTQKLIVNK